MGPIARRLCRATSDERLLSGALRHNLGFLISHFWLLSEALASLLFLRQTGISTRRAVSVDFEIDERQHLDYGVNQPFVLRMSVPLVL